MSNEPRERLPISSNVPHVGGVRHKDCGGAIVTELISDDIVKETINGVETGQTFRNTRYGLVCETCRREVQPFEMDPPGAICLARI